MGEVESVYLVLKGQMISANSEWRGYSLSTVIFSSSLMRFFLILNSKTVSSISTKLTQLRASKLS